MQTIKVEQDVFDDLLHEVVETGKSFSEVIRDALEKARLFVNSKSRGSETAPEEMNDSEDAELAEFLASPEYRAKETAVDRFLAVLSAVHSQRESEFEKILSLRGRTRNYYGKSRAELGESGSSVYPKPIPGSDYYVITNNNTDQKKAMLRRALKLFGYGEAVIGKVMASL